jgi:ABC-type transporter Mla MlaB component
VADFRIQVVSEPAVEVVIVSGPLGRDAQPRLTFLLDALLRRGKPVVVDLSAVTNLDVAALTALAATSRALGVAVEVDSGRGPPTTGGPDSWGLLVQIPPPGTVVYNDGQPAAPATPVPAEHVAGDTRPG